MQKLEIHYPLYRKYAHNKTFFKVLSEDSFEQLDIIGNKYVFDRFDARIHPDKVYIHDLTWNEKGHWEEIHESEYTEALNFCKTHLKEVQKK